MSTSVRPLGVTSTCWPTAIWSILSTETEVLAWYWAEPEITMVCDVVAVSPFVNGTESTVPPIGLTMVAAFTFCSAAATFASAAITAADAAEICSLVAAATVVVCFGVSVEGAALAPLDCAFVDCAIAICRLASCFACCACRCATSRCVRNASRSAASHSLLGDAICSIASSVLSHAAANAAELDSDALSAAVRAPFVSAIAR